MIAHDGDHGDPPDTVEGGDIAQLLLLLGGAFRVLRGGDRRHLGMMAAARQAQGGADRPHLNRKPIF